jgi:glycosyltransferase involved in cell wall biosynthesis
MINQPIVVYICNAIDETLRKERQINTDSPAASNKVFSLSRAMYVSGIRCIVLSLGRGRQNGNGKCYSPIVSRSGRTVVIYCGFLNLPFLTHCFTAINLLSIFLWIFRKKKNIILLTYNRTFHYLPTLIAARIIKIRSFLDLEDGYENTGHNFYCYLKNLYVRYIFDFLCSDGNMVANTFLARQLSSPISLVCYGVAENINSPIQDWQSQKLKIIFSGTLLKEVGSSLLIDTIKILNDKRPELAEYIHFVITGKGPYAEDFRSLSEQLPQWMSFFHSIDRNEYLKVLRNCHIGLSLRLKSYEMASTTFPSKTVEYAENGLLVLTTRTSDISLLFGDTALYLNEEIPHSLADMLALFPFQRTSLKIRAEKGRNQVLTKCSPQVVGLGIRNMLGLGI